MSEEQSNHRAFWGSPHHAALGLATLGAGLVAANPLALAAGVVAYALGWIYLPDMRFFTGWLARRRAAAALAEEQRQVAEFSRRRGELLFSLHRERQMRYAALAEVCRDIEGAGAEQALADGPAGAGDTRMRKLDELMWTFLRLLAFEQSLEKYVDIEQREDLPGQLKCAAADLAGLKQELEQKKAAGDADAESLQRLVDSRSELLDVLDKRCRRAAQAQSNLALVESELERLEQQIKLVGADAVARKNADALSARIDATVDHLEQTNRWLAEMDEFKDLNTGLPETAQRVGFEAAGLPPPLAAADAGRAPRGRIPLQARQTQRR